MPTDSSTILRLADVEDRYPPRDRRIKTSLALLPEDHRALALLSLDSGIDQQSLVRRALVVAGVLPAGTEER